jgi:small nuclear ribonucleoprotein (snRNP)-like protein/uncharacterized protein YoxC
MLVQAILIMIGISIVAFAVALWMFRGRLMAVLGVIDNGFKIIEDTIQINLLDNNAGLDKTKSILSETSNILNDVQSSIRIGGNIIAIDVIGTMNTAGDAMVNEVAPTLATSHQIIHDGHGVLQSIGLDIGGLDIHWHPFGTENDPHTFVGKLHAVDTQVNAMSNTSTNIGNNIYDTAHKLSDINAKLINVADGVQNISTNISGLIPFIDTNIRNGFQNAVTLLQQTRTSLSQILGVINPTMIIALFVAGIGFVIVGTIT